MFHAMTTDYCDCEPQIVLSYWICAYEPMYTVWKKH